MVIHSKTIVKSDSQGYNFVRRGDGVRAIFTPVKGGKFRRQVDAPNKMVPGIHTSQICFRDTLLNSQVSMQSCSTDENENELDDGQSSNDNSSTQSNDVIMMRWIIP